MFVKSNLVQKIIFLPKKDVENIQTKKQVFRYHTKTKKHLFTTIITTMGMVENSHKLNSVDQVVVLDDLFVV